MEWKSLVVSVLAVFIVVFTMSPPSPTNARGSGQCNPHKKNSPQMVKIRDFKSSWQMQRGCEFPNSQNVSYVLKIFYKKWKERFGDKNGLVLKNMNNLMIEWDSKEKIITGTGFDINGNPLTGRARGLTLLPGYIWVWENRYQRLAATALVHELVHAALWANSGSHGDPDHEGPDFTGWTPDHTKFIKEINDLLARLDI